MAFGKLGRALKTAKRNVRKFGKDFKRHSQNKGAFRHQLLERAQRKGNARSVRLLRKLDVRGTKRAGAVGLGIGSYAGYKIGKSKKESPPGSVAFSKRRK